MSSTVQVYGALLIIILIPILPSYLLFSILPSRADVSGPFQGLEIKLGGAFAGYFLLVLLVIFQLPRIRSVILPETSEVWTVQGYLYDEHGQGLSIAPGDIQFLPPAQEGDGSGWFTATFATELTKSGGMPAFPRLSVSHSGFPNATIPLDPNDAEAKTLQASRDETTHLLVLKPLVFKKPASPYAPVGTPLKAGDPSAYTAAVQASVKSSQ